MAGLRVFVSSTCYDLAAVRGQLRMFLQAMGYEPVMSDYNDVLYDPRMHTHTSCVQEVSGCDMVVLILGSRFGGRAIPDALKQVDFDSLASSSKSVEALKQRGSISITQLEILKAIEDSIPIFAFVEDRLWHDHALYEKNKNKPIVKEIDFPSVEKFETAKFIFEFVNFLRQRTNNNSVYPFSKTHDIEEVLRKQWSTLFQKMLNEARATRVEERKMDRLAEQFEDLKTAILTSIGSNNEREVARGVVRFRRLVDFLRGLGVADTSFVTTEQHTWSELLHSVGIVDRIEISESRGTRFGPRPRVALIREDKTFYEVRFSEDWLADVSLDWEAFVQLPPQSRQVITDALGEMRGMDRWVRYVNRPFDAEYPEAAEAMSG